MSSWYFSILLLILAMKPIWISSLICSRYPANTLTPKSPVDENFAILINNNPQTYILGQEYNVSINAFNGHRFITFSLALENDNGYFNVNEDLGHFEINDPIETRFSPKCINMVESTNTNPKVHSDVIWVAPTDPNSGCVLIRATLLQHRDVWHMDDGGLTRRICQEVVDEVENQRARLGQECCACDEARYELTFQGIWNRNLHPRHFPQQGWVTRFGDIIGASHTSDYRFWRDGEYATPGMKEYVEHGFSLTLERDFNQFFKDGNIRTIIKARGPAFPNLNGISVASVRVDPQHHLVSLVSKIDPSPDWFVGVSGLELCMQNCTWLEERIIQLYPWDAGTDAGPSYTSPDQPQLPADVIRRMRSNSPNDPRSPFYDDTGAAMAPFATLVVKRQRVYERLCDNEDSNNIDRPRECHTHPWTAWTPCSARCGEGRTYRTRVYKQPELAKMYKCDPMTVLKEDRICRGQNCVGPEAEFGGRVEGFNVEPDFGDRQNMAECELTPWSDWSECSNTCGEGITMRERQFKNPASQAACQSASYFKLMDKKKCHGQQCQGDLPNNRRMYENKFSDIERDDIDNDNAMDINRGRVWNSPRSNSNDFGYQPNNGLNRPWNNPNREDEVEQTNYGNRNQNFPRLDSGNEPYEVEPSNPWNNNNYDGFEVGNLREVPLMKTPAYNRKNFNRDGYKSVLTNPSMNSALNPLLIPPVNEELPPKMLVPPYCFDKLQIFNCLNHTVIANFWFYNYCEDECMLFAADSCDQNKNKFKSLEDCELMCQRPENEPYLQYQQQLSCPPTETRQTRLKRKKVNSQWWRH